MYHGHFRAQKIFGRGWVVIVLTM